jgi:hypothetical protein
MIAIFIGIIFLIASYLFYNNTEDKVPIILRILVCQIGIFIGLFCLNLDLGILK